MYRIRLYDRTLALASGVQVATELGMTPKSSVGLSADSHTPLALTLTEQRKARARAPSRILRMYCQPRCYRSPGKGQPGKPLLNESSHLYLFVWLNAEARLALCSYPCFIEKWRRGVSWSCLQTTESAPFMIYIKQDVIP
jgi:hypothetical protein